MTLIRRAARWGLYTLFALVATAAVGAVLLNTEWAHERARLAIESRASTALAADVRIRDFKGSFWSGVTAGELSITQNGRPVITAASAAVRYRPWRVFTGGAIEEVRLTRLHLNIVEDATGWNIAGLGGPRDPRGTSTRVSIARIEVADGAIDVFPLGAGEHHIRDLAFAGALTYENGRLEITANRASGSDRETGLTLRELSARAVADDQGWTVDDFRLATLGSRLRGRLRFGNDAASNPIDVSITGSPLSLEEVSRYVPVLKGVALSPETTIAMKGKAAAFAYQFDATSSEGGAVASQGTGSWNDAKLVLDGGVKVTGFDPSQWTGRRDVAGRIDAGGRATLNVPERVRDLTVTFDLTAPSVAVADLRVAQVRARGIVGVDTLDATGSGLAYGASAAGDVHWRNDTWTSAGRVRGVNVSALPRRFALPAVSSRVNGVYDVMWSARAWHAAMTFDDSIVEDASIAGGSKAQITSERGGLAYSADMHVANLDLARVRRFASLPPALEKIDGRLTGHVRGEGQGDSLAGTIARAEVHLAGSTIAGADVRRLDAIAALDRGRLVADATVDLGSVDTAKFGAPEPAATTGNGAGTVHVDVPDVAHFTPEAMSGSAALTVTDLIVRGERIDRAIVDASIVNGTADIRTFTLESEALRANATGRLAIDPANDEQSDVAYEITISNLAVLEPWIKRNVSGTLAAAGTLTGPASRPATTGKLRASRLDVAGKVSALGIDGDYSLEAPDRDIARLTGKVSGAASLLGVSGREIDRVATTAIFDAGRIDANAVIDAQGRRVEIGGTVVPHPEHREVHLRQLALTAGNGTWMLPAGQEALVQYADDAVTVRNLELARGDGRIRVDGAIDPTGGPGSAIDVIAERVRLEDLNSVLLGTRQVAGQLDGRARIEGTIVDLRVSGSAAVTQATVEGVAIERLDAKADYAKNAVTLDARLQAGTSGELTATGTMPTTFGADAPANAVPFDLRLHSSQLNLALLNALSPHVENVTGIGSIDVKVTGAAKAPKLAGTANVADAAFRVAATGITYSRANAALAFDGDRLLVKQLTVSDEDNHAATITGGLNLAVGAPPRDFDLHIDANDFHLLNNPFGELALSVQIQAMGDLVAPLLSGTIEVERGRLEVDDLLDRFGVTGYRAIGRPDLVAAAQTEAVPPMFSKASYSITLALPDNLVLRGRDLRTSAGSFGLGDVNITLGGALILNKDTDTPTTIKGRVDVVRGTYTFQGRRFDIQRGSEVVFSGGDELDPTLNVTAERQIGGVTAIVRVNGTARQPIVALSSSPSLDQGDVLSLIVFNQTMNELSSNARVNLAARAGTIAARALATPLSDSIARALDFDLFEITPSDENSGATITVGRQVSENLFVGFKQNVGNDDVSQVSFEYRLSQFLRLVTSFAQGADRSRSIPRAETAGIDLFFVIRR